MDDSGLPKITVQFIAECIDSVEQLQVLLLLHGDPTRHWTIEQISRELRSSESSVEKRIADLVARKAIQNPKESGATYRYIPFSEDTAKNVDELARVYKLYPYRVIDQIYAKPRHAVQSFADSFQFRKRGDNK